MEGTWPSARSNEEGEGREGADRTGWEEDLLKLVEAKEGEGRIIGGRIEGDRRVETGLIWDIRLGAHGGKTRVTMKWPPGLFLYTLKNFIFSFFKNLPPKVL